MAGQDEGRVYGEVGVADTRHTVGVGGGERGHDLRAERVAGEELFFEFEGVAESQTAGGAALGGVQGAGLLDAP